ncbi:polyketide synthase [Embleya hyalina]|uniref:Polyketide synthase n=2 Tax=Embleya hyalina TaxID=516124 RepID=A0A401Z2J0_9ACTN|nr:polyketide synthase [Embleya hyalina]
MAAGLLECSPVFAEAVAECAAVMDPLVGDWSLLEVLRGGSAGGLERVDVVQPVLFAVMVGLARWWESCGVRPGAVVGHSQGEIAAAHVAGHLSLADAVRVVVLRSRALLGVASSGGGMVSVGVSADRARELVAGDDRLSLAAVNGPTSVVLSGDVDALAAVVEVCGRDGVRARWIPVDYASHSVRMEAVRGEVERLLADVTPQPGRVPMYSTVTGEVVVDPAELGGSYWFENLRRTVELERAVGAATADGLTTFVECSPHPGLVVPLGDTLEALRVDGAVLETLRRGEGGPDRLVAALSAAFVAGVAVDWAGMIVGARVELPTYAFQRRRYWLAEGARSGDPGGLGLAAVGHPLLGAAVRPAQGTGLLFTGRLSTATHPWLADHVVLGSTIVPGTVFVDLALWAGAEAACPVVDELTLHTPLVLPEHGGVHVQVTVDGPDDVGARAVAVYSRPEDAPDDEPWTRHAVGVLVADDDAGPDAAPEVWPPVGAKPVEVADFYRRLVDSGVDYGPAFRGMRAAWRRGDELFADVALPAEEEPDAHRFGVHPALLDAGVQTLRVDPGQVDGDDIRVAFSWHGVRLFAGGATRLRVSCVPSGEGAVSLRVADETGRAVAAIEALTVRAISAEQVRRAGGGRDALFRLVWRASAVSVPVAAPRVAVVGEWDPPGPGGPVDRYPGVAELAAHEGPLPDLVLLPVGRPDPDVPFSERRMRDTTAELAARLEAFVGDERLAAARVVVVTRSAVVVDGDTGLGDPASAAVWGVVRAAQAGHPERIVLVDLDDDPASAAIVAAVASAGGEPQFAVRGGRVWVPGLERVPASGGARSALGTGTVLIAGADRAVGAGVAEHLAGAYGVGRFLLSSADPSGDGSGALAARLREAGAEVVSAAWDGHDPGVLAALVAEHPLVGVVDASGGADGARALHELTVDTDLAFFVLFSSAANLLGSTAHAATAGASAFLDALAGHRRAHGLPGVSLACGTDPLSGLPDLFDEAMCREDAVLVSASTDLTGPGSTSPLLPSRSARGATVPAETPAATDGEALVRRLAALSEEERERELVGLVRAQAAAVLGHAGTGEIGPERAFKEVGFDSLTAVELRNRLIRGTGVGLRSTLVFDFPTPRILARHLSGRLVEAASPAGALLADLDRFEDELHAVLGETEARDRLAERLRRLLARCTAPDESTPAADVSDVQSATDDELFSLVDQGFE